MNKPPDLFNVTKLGIPNVTLIVGKRRSGKTALIVHLVQKSELEHGLIFGAGNGFDDNYNYQSKFPKAKVCEEFDLNLLADFVNNRKTSIRSCNTNKPVKNEKPLQNEFLIFDDVFNDSTIIKSESFRFLMHNCRYLGVSIFMSTSNVMSLTQNIRASVDYIFLLHETDFHLQEKLYHSFGGVCRNDALFYEIFMKATQNYNALVIDNCTLSDKLEDNVFWYNSFITNDSTMKSNETPIEVDQNEISKETDKGDPVSFWKRVKDLFWWQ